MKMRAERLKKFTKVTKIAQNRKFILQKTDEKFWGNLPKSYLKSHKKVRFKIYVNGRGRKWK